MYNCNISVDCDCLEELWIECLQQNKKTFDIELSSSSEILHIKEGNNSLYVVLEVTEEEVKKLYKEVNEPFYLLPEKDYHDDIKALPNSYSIGEGKIEALYLRLRSVKHLFTTLKTSESYIGIISDGGEYKLYLYTTY